MSEAIFDFSYRGAGRGLWNGLGFWVHFAVPANCNTVIWRQKKNTVIRTGAASSPRTDGRPTTPLPSFASNTNGDEGGGSHAHGSDVLSPQVIYLFDSTLKQ